MYLSVVGHLGCFHSLAVVNSTVINMGVQVFFNNLSHIPLGIVLGVVLLDHMADLFSFLRSLHIVFHSVVLAYVPTSSV
jgi:hypothetical protein